MMVKDIMTKDVVTADAGKSAREIAKLMTDKNTGTVVITENGKCRGLVTDREIVVHAVGKGLNVDEVTAREIMHDDPVTCKEEDSIWDAAKACVSRGPFRRIPVVDLQGKVVGILSLADIALVAHPLVDAVLRETEASVDETKVREGDLKRMLLQQVKR